VAYLNKLLYTHISLSGLFTPTYYNFTAQTYEGD